MLSETWATWEIRNLKLIREAIGEIAEAHPALRANELITRICQGIERQDDAAISLALALLNEDPRIPFGRILKSHIARSFKAVAAHLTAYHRSQLMRFRDKLRSLEYPPAELKYFERLGRELERYPPARPH
jgi:hypothetical protein